MTTDKVDISDKIEKVERVNHPSHYTSGGMEVIDIIEAFNLSFCSGNAIKYILRSGAKLDFEGQDPKAKAVEDLRKAAWYINRRIMEIEKDVCD